MGQKTLLSKHDEMLQQILHMLTGRASYLQGKLTWFSLEAC